MADNSGFRVDRLGTVDARFRDKGVDRIFTILDYPWIAIWMSPRETIKKIVSRDPTSQVILLGALAGGLSLTNFFLAMALSPAASAITPHSQLNAYLPILTLTSPFLGAAIGVLTLYMNAFLLDWSGRALDGVGNAVTVRAAVAWSSVPVICLSAVTLLILLGAGTWNALGLSMPDPNAAAEAIAAAKNPFSVTRGIEAIISAWSFILMLNGVAAVHRFSIWRALGAAVLPTIILGGIAFAAFVTFVIV
ncbi:MAG TPA: Yip1 family protein [Candidatus Binataceae bacterium]